ncbi:NAD(P)/FAD-dependent oxidoreductase [Roseibium salinum]|nr:NAD(P)/FAD-dependent oxidoreductase [Roseibium salinum]
MCGIEAAKRGRRVLVVDHAAKPAEKIRISGGAGGAISPISTARRQISCPRTPVSVFPR